MRNTPSGLVRREPHEFLRGIIGTHIPFSFVPTALLGRLDVSGERRVGIVDEHDPPVGQAVGLLHGRPRHRSAKTSLGRHRMHHNFCQVRRNGQQSNFIFKFFMMNCLTF